MVSFWAENLHFISFFFLTDRKYSYHYTLYNKLILNFQFPKVLENNIEIVSQTQRKENKTKMASTDTDVTLIPTDEGSNLAGPSSSAPTSAASKKPKRFEIKKWNAVSLWAWGN